MTTVLCTDAERDLILAGARHLVVPGDPGCEGCHDRWTHAKVHGDEGWLPPQRWVDTTGPCPTCGGDGNHPLYWSAHPQGTCPDCIDGRKRVALVAVCATCGDRAEWCGYGDGLPDDNPNCSAGSVVFAHATVEIWLDPLPVPGRDWVVVLDNVELAQ